MYYMCVRVCGPMIQSYFKRSIKVYYRVCPSHAWPAKSDENVKLCRNKSLGMGEKEEENECVLEDKKIGCVCASVCVCVQNTRSSKEMEKKE